MPKSTSAYSATFAKRLRQERERAGITQAELAGRIAERMGTKFDSSQITRIEKQRRGVRLEEAALAAEALGLPLTSLLVDDVEATFGQRTQQSLELLERARRDWDAAQEKAHRCLEIIERLVRDQNRHQQQGMAVAEGELAAPDDRGSSPASAQFPEGLNPVVRALPKEQGTD